MSISKIKTALRKGMDDIKSIFTGRWKIIEIYVKSKMNEIKALRRIKEVNLNLHRINIRLGQGAQPTPTVENLLKRIQPIA